MLRVSRRRTIGLVGAAASLTGAAGCLFRERGSIELSVRNQDTAPHSVRVEFLQDDEPRYEEQFNLNATSVEVRAESAPSDTYNITVTVDGTTRDTATILMSSCRDLDQRVEVRIGQDGRVNGIVFPNNICGD